jgi:hypothetical protein
MVLDRLGGWFYCIGAVMVCLELLYCGVLDFAEVLDGMGTFIVQDMRFGSVPDRL